MQSSILAQLLWRSNCAHWLRRLLLQLRYSKNTIDVTHNHAQKQSLLYSETVDGAAGAEVPEEHNGLHFEGSFEQRRTLQRASGSPDSCLSIILIQVDEEHRWLETSQRLASCRAAVTCSRVALDADIAGSTCSPNDENRIKRKGMIRQVL